MMELNYIKGNKNDFLNFIDLITKEDKVAIMTHTDLDGLASGIFLEKILENKGINIDYIDFLEVKTDMVEEVSVKLKSKNITKVFFTDLSIDNADIEGFRELRKDMDVFLIDHHPMNENIKNLDNVIKTDSQDCVAMTCFFMGEDFIDTKEWAWLCCAAIFSDFSYKEKKNLEYIQSIYPDVDEDNISSSIPGLNGRKINSALIYYENDKKYVYDLVKNRDLEKIEEIHSILEDEIEKIIFDFNSKAEHYKDRHLHLYEIDSKFNITSTVCSIISKMKKEDTFVFYQRKSNGIIKFSARNQGGTEDVGNLMKKCTEGIEEASGGGHKPAAAAKIQEKDFDEFKKRLIENTENRE